MKREYVPALIIVMALVVVAISGIGPHDRLTWFLEIAPIFAGVAILVYSYRRFPLSHLLYAFLLLHAVVLAVGGHYTYANVPAGFWVQEWLELSRHPYDRLGHLAQGFVPALLAREILIRRSPLENSKWLPFLVVCVCLSFSALYELIEWWAALILDQSADQFLGTQGDVWDTQWDMFMALIGAITALTTLGKAHDRSIAKVAM